MLSDDNFGLGDDELWGDPTADDSRIVGPLLDAGFVGERIAAPEKVHLDARETLPVVFARVASMKDVAKHPMGRAVITAVDLDTGVLRADLAFWKDQAKRKVSVPLPPELAGDADEEESGTVALVKTLDARARLDVEWSPGKQLLTMLLMDHVSNRRVVTLVPSASAVEDAVAKGEKERAEQERIRVGPPAAGPYATVGEPYAHFRKRVDSPAVPEKPGIAMAAPRVFVMDSAPACVLTGAFRVPLARHRIVPRGRTFTDGTPEPYRAVVPLTLLLIGSERPNPMPVAMEIPVFEEIDAASPPESVTGYFAVDLLAYAGAEGASQTFFLYAFSGEALAGPLPVAFVPPELLPHR